MNLFHCRLSQVKGAYFETVWHFHFVFQANELACLTGHSDKVLSVSANEKAQLCTSSIDRSIKLWSCDPQEQTSIGGHDAPITFVCNNPFTSGQLISGSR